MTTYQSNGKLLLTAEYLVLDGATALAVPTKFGQTMTVETNDSEVIVWSAADLNGDIWFETFYSFSEIIKQIKQPIAISQTLMEILHQSHLQSPQILASKKGYKINTYLNFDRNWGLGTSSTLINNIASWFNINAFDLLQNAFGGSGYDIACAQNNQPVLYKIENQKPQINIIDFNPIFKEKLFFVYLNQKQNSKSAIETYRSKQKQIEKTIIAINNITNQMVTCTSLTEFMKLLDKHEDIMSTILEQPTIKSQLFADFDGSIKSLGAWGGDFVLVASEQNPTDYFSLKGYNTIISYCDMVL